MDSESSDADEASPSKNTPVGSISIGNEMELPASSNKGSLKRKTTRPLPEAEDNRKKKQAISSETSDRITSTSTDKSDVSKNLEESKNFLSRLLRTIGKSTQHCSENDQRSVSEEPDLDLFNRHQLELRRKLIESKLSQNDLQPTASFSGFQETVPILKIKEDIDTYLLRLNQSVAKLWEHLESPEELLHLLTQLKTTTPEQKDCLRQLLQNTESERFNGASRRSSNSNSMPKNEVEHNESIDSEVVDSLSEDFTNTEERTINCYGDDQPQQNREAESQESAQSNNILLNQINLVRFNEFLNDMQVSEAAKEWLDQRITRPNFMSILIKCPFLSGGEVNRVEEFWKSLRSSGFSQPTELFSTNTYLIIACVEQSQGDDIVEKFFVVEESVEAICNFKNDLNFFYRDFSTGLNIEFKQLNDYKLDVVGFLGKLRNFKQFLKDHLTMKSLSEFSETVEKAGSGLYLIAPKAFEEENPCKCFVYFYSKDDEDYQQMDAKSRSIHLIRYLTELTKNVVLLLDETDLQLFSVKVQPHINLETSFTEVKFHFHDQNEQKEQMFIDEHGIVPPMFPIPDGFFRMHGSEMGLCLFNAKLKPSETRMLVETRYFTVEDFSNSFSLKNIKENANVCDEFVMSYIEKMDYERFRDVEQQIRDRKKALMSHLKKEQFFESLDFALTLKLFRKKSSCEFLILKWLIETSDLIPSVVSRLRKQFSELDLQTEHALTFDEEQELLHAMGHGLFEASISCFILQKLLASKNVTCSFLSFDEIVEKCYETRVFQTAFHTPGDKNARPSLDSELVQKVMQETVNNLSNPQKALEQLKDMILGKMEFLMRFCAEKVTAGRSFLKLPLLRKQKLQEYTREELRTERTRMMRQLFDKLSTKKKSAPGSSLDTQVTHIVPQFAHQAIRSSKFRVTFERIEVQDEKLELKITKLCQRNSTLQNSNELQINGKNWVFRVPQQIDLPKCEVIKVFPIAASLVLLLLNKNRLSTAAVFNMDTKQELSKIEFEKTIR